MGGGTIYGNSSLKPEKSNNFEVGARYAGRAVEADFALFYNLADDYISTEHFNSREYRYVNADKDVYKRQIDTPVRGRKREFLLYFL